MLKGTEELTLFFHKLERLEADELRVVPTIIEPSQLASIAIVEQFEKMVKEIIDTDDREAALLGRRLIEDIMLPQYPNLRIENPPIYRRYRKLIVLLRFLNLSIHGMKIISELIRENLLTVLQSGINIRDKFQFILEVYHDVSMEGHIAEELGQAITACEDRLGVNSIIKDDGKIVPPTVGNWLSEYLQMGLSGPEHKTGSLERIQFFKINRNAQKLSEPEKKLLLKIFRLYDWLLYGGNEEEELKSEAAAAYTSVEKFVLPESTQGDLRPPGQRPMVPPVPVRPVHITLPQSPYPHPGPLPSTVAKAMVDKKGEGGERKPTPKPLNPVKSSGGGALQQPFNRVNIQDILNKKPPAGISFGAGLPPQNLTAEVLKKQMEERQRNSSQPPLMQRGGVMQTTSPITLTPSFAKASEGKPTLSQNHPIPARQNNGEPRYGERGDRAEEIDKKLEDLKKRVDKK